MASLKSGKLLLVFCIITLQLCLIPTTTDALNTGGVGVGLGKKFIKLFEKKCSRKCESRFCRFPPFMRYGKYCGILYSGCPGEKPCDALDACCMRHDLCIKKNNNNYLNVTCNENLRKCVKAFQNSRAPTFKGNKCQVKDVTKIIDSVMAKAIAAGKKVGKH